MTAIGFVLLVVFGLAFGCADLAPYGWRDRARDLTAAGTIAGLILIVAGLATWLWRVMP
jgi:hypothetical protein